ncbi:class I glutamine amidotransferase-like protein [Podospora didyma]|uniref:Class I glutamine amidotransferase-like protein n=1 Tax=Podospora didyma TaxID=330526 RepID=A0AAE0P6V9_9PEZI|nr:class I glutamine amidotransferase-like protein [Podospora didyma]
MDGSNSRKTVRIGVFIPTEAQLLDVAVVDVLGSTSCEYFRIIDAPSVIIDLAPRVTIFCTVQPGELIPTTSNLKLECTHHLSDPEVQPGKLDIVLVPGPNPKSTWDDPVTSWLAAHAARSETDILSVCTGVFLCGAAGILKGKKACGPRSVQSILRSRFEGVTWPGGELRWVKDGNIWSSGGITNGNDMVAAYIRDSPHFPGPSQSSVLL